MTKNKISAADREEMLKRIIVSLGVGTLAISEADKGKLLYHYTTIEALYNGIIVKDPVSEEKAISLYATDSDYLNDTTEIHYGNAQVFDMIKNPQAAEFSTNNILNNSKDVQRFVISFSKVADSLPMWATYGKRGTGIALGFDIIEVLKSLALVYPCFYHKKDVQKYIKGLYSFMDDNTHFQTDFKFDTPIKRAFRDGYIHEQLTTLIKHPAYEYEQEVRFVCSEKQLDNILFRYANNLIIPYTIEYLPKKALKSIIVGPNLNRERVKQSIEHYIIHKGFTDVKIIESTVPYRD